MGKYETGKGFWGLFGAIIFCHLLGGAMIIVFANTHTWVSGTVEYNVENGATTQVYKLELKEFSPTRYSYDTHVDDASKYSVETFFYWDAQHHTNAPLLALGIQQVLLTIGGGLGLWVAIMYAFGARFGRFAVPVFAKAATTSLFASMIAGAGLYFFIAFSFYNTTVKNFNNQAGGTVVQEVFPGFKAGYFSAAYISGAAGAPLVCTGWAGGSSIYLGDKVYPGTTSAATPLNCKSNSINLGYSMILVIIGIGFMGIGSILGFVAHIVSCLGDSGNELGDGASNFKSAVGSAVDEVRSAASDAKSAASNLSISGSINISVDVEASAGSS